MRIVGKVYGINFDFFTKIQNGGDNDCIYTVIKKDTPCIVNVFFYDSRHDSLYYDVEFENGIFIYKMRTRHYNINIGEWVNLIYYGKYIKENDVEPGTIVFAEIREGAYLAYAFLKRNNDNIVKWKTLDNKDLENSWSVYTYVKVEEKKE